MTHKETSRQLERTGEKPFDRAQDYAGHQSSVCIQTTSFLYSESDFPIEDCYCMPFFDTDFTTLPNNKATKLANITCAYCGGEAEPDNPLTDEHVIGRKFVPKGSFAKGW